MPDLDPDQIPTDRVKKLSDWLVERNIGICELDEDLVDNSRAGMDALALELLQHGPPGIRYEPEEGQ